MKKWFKNNKGILIMGAFFAIGSSVTAALVCSVPNYVITSIEVHTVPYSPAPAIAGTDGRTEALFFAEETGYSQRGGRKHIFYNWSLERDKNDNAPLPSWLSIEPMYDNKGHTTNLARLVWTNKCRVDPQYYHLYAIASHLDVSGETSTPYQFIVSAA